MDFTCSQCSLTLRLQTTSVPSSCSIMLRPKHLNPHCASGALVSTPIEGSKPSPLIPRGGLAQLFRWQQVCHPLLIKLLHSLPVLTAQPIIRNPKSAEPANASKLTTHPSNPLHHPIISSSRRRGSRRRRRSNALATQCVGHSPPRRRDAPTNRQPRSPKQLTAGAGSAEPALPQE